MSLTSIESVDTIIIGSLRSASSGEHANASSMGSVPASELVLIALADLDRSASLDASADLVTRYPVASAHVSAHIARHLDSVAR